MAEIKAQASTRKKWNNAQEWRPLPTLSAEGITVEGDGELMRPLASALMSAGKSPDDTLSMHRGDTPCLRPDTLEKWAYGKAHKGKQPERLKRGA